MRSPRECAQLIYEIYTSEFGGEQAGRYAISRGDLINITGRPVWHQTLIEDVADWLVELGLILIDRDSFFYVMQPSDLDGVRLAEGETLTRYLRPVKFGAALDT